MGTVLDLAVGALTVMVVASLGLLAWTIAIGSARAVDGQRQRVAGARATVGSLRGRLERIPEGGRA